MKGHKTKNTIKNFSIGAITQVFNILISFIVRTVFIISLGKTYLGINGLFTNILTILSLAELGIGQAIIYSMYRPVALEDKEKIKALMRLYQKCYIMIGFIIMTLGMSIIPFMGFIIKDAVGIKENIIFIYVLFLLNTSLSYFFSYRKSILSANQKEYVINLNKIIFVIIKAIGHIFILLVTKNFILYLLVDIICTFLENLLISIKAKIMYPYLNDKDVEYINNDEKKLIFKNVKALILYKIGSVVLNGTDNIIISSMIGIVMVGLLSNYNMIVAAVAGITSVALSSITGILGNLNAVEKPEKKENVFKNTFFISMWIIGFCSICLMILINHFIEIWIGEEYLLSYFTILALVLNMYVSGVQFTSYTYRITLGLFVKGKYTPILAAIINIILSIILCKYFGIAGVIFATSISRLLTTSWYDPYMIYKYEFRKSPVYYYRTYILYFGIVVLNYLVSSNIVNFITVVGIRGFTVKLLICLILPNIIFLLIFYRTSVLKEVAVKFGFNKILFLRNI
jgi:O-antigen/teichoic acid export membrane protein